MSDSSEVLFAGVRSLCANTLRKDDIEHIIGRVVSGKFSADYDLNFLSGCFERFFESQIIANRVISKRKMFPELSSFSRYAHPFFIICFDVAKRYLEGDLKLEQIATLAQNTSPLGVEVKYNKKFADNHVHLGGCHDSTTSLLHIACASTNDIKLRSPYLNTLPYYTTGHLSMENVVDLFKEIHALLTEFAILGDPAIPLHIEQIHKLLKNREIRLSDHQKTSLDFFGKVQLPKPSEPHHYLLWKAIDAYKAGDDENAFFLYITALYTIYLQYPGNKTVCRFIKCFIHLANILRSSMVMSEGIGLGSFKEYYGFPLRTGSRDRHTTVARSLVMSGTTHIEGRIAPDNIVKQCTAYLKSFQSAKAQRNKLHPSMCSELEIKFCVHFLRTGSSGRASSTSTCRFKRARKEAKQKAVELAKELRQARVHLSDSVEAKLKPDSTVPLVTFITGFDVAGDESLAPIEIYAPALRFLRSNTSSYEGGVHHFKLCLHAGEDFSHILSGIRKIDETFQFCDMQPGDRIGHAVALGIDPAAWLLKVNEGFCSKCEFLDNLVWAVNRAPTNRRFRARWKNVISKYKDGIAKLSKEIYGAEYATTTLYEAWLLRKNCPTCRDDNPKGPSDQYRYHAAPDYGPGKYRSQEADELFLKYLNDTTAYTIGEEKLLFRGQYGDDTADHVIDNEEVGFLQALQKHMLKLLTTRKIAIECNFSSNTFIGSFEGFGNHPLFAWSPPNGGLDQVGEIKKTGAAFQNVCICSDDPAMFCTSLQNEFNLLREAAARSNQKYQSEEIEKWLERLRKRGVKIFESKIHGAKS